MNDKQKDLVKRWVANLRSGNYKQGKSRLRIEDQFCCLGVLCDVLRPELTQAGHVADWRAPTNQVMRSLFSGASDFVVDGEEVKTVLPGSIVRDYGLIGDEGDFFITQAMRRKFPKCEAFAMHKTYCLMHLNDVQQWTFDEIADLLEFFPECFFKKEQGF